MSNIYLSSTFEDLKEYRDLAGRALRKLQHRVIGMEDYVASDERPLDKCLQDVARCDINPDQPGGHAGADQAAYPSDPVHIGLVVAAVAVVAALGAEQTLLLVVAQHPLRHAGAVRELADPHRSPKWSGKA